MNIRENNRRQGPFQRLAAWIQRAIYGPPPVQVEIQWPMAQTSKIFLIQRFDREQVELLIWMMYGAGLEHNQVSVMLENMATAKMAGQAEIEAAMAATEPVKDALNKVWSAGPTGPQ